MGCERLQSTTLLKVILLVSFILFGSSVSFADVVSIVGPFVEGSGNWNTVDNGGFEDGLSGWTNYAWAGTGEFQVTPDYAAFGNYSAAAIPAYDFTGYGFCLKRQITVEPDTDYILSGFFYTGNLSSDAFYLDLDDVSFEEHVLAPVGVDNWQFVYAPFHTPEWVTQVTVRLVRDGDVKKDEIGYIDEVAITPLSEFKAPAPVPIPSALVLLGGGLAGIFLRKKKS